MKFSYNWLKELVAFKESPEKLAELLTLRSFEVESAEKAASDWKLNIVLLPNRIPDASGHIGLAREIAAINGSKLKNDAVRVKKYGTGLIRQFLDVKIENSEDCPRYLALMIDGVKVKESPAWLKQRLELCGLQPINNLVDAANYVMLETGQPLHVFDYDKLDNNESRKREIPNYKFQITNKSQIPNSKFKNIVIRKAKKGERIVGLDDKEYELNPEILVIAGSEKPIAIAGIKGGKESGVTNETKTIVLEAANFNRAAIRLGSKSLNLKTDASYRFEHGLDPNLADFAIWRLADLIYRLAGGTAKGTIDVYPRKINPVKLPFRLEYANRLIGVEISPQFYKNALQGLGMTVEEKNKSPHLIAGYSSPKEGLGTDIHPRGRTSGYLERWGDKTEFIVEVPTNRRDLLFEEDLIEETARLYGYENIIPKPPHIAGLLPEKNNELLLTSKTREILKGAGFAESFIYQFIGDRELAEFDDSSKNYFEIENPPSPDAKYLTAKPLFNYLKQVAENTKNFNSVKIFGIAKAFNKLEIGNYKLEVGEQKRLIIALAKKGAKGEEEFYELKGVIDSLFESLGITDHWYDDTINLQPYRAEPSGFRPTTYNLQLFHPYRLAEIKIGENKVGIIGEIHPNILENIKSKARIIAAEIDFGFLKQSAEKEAEYRPISKYPAIIRDIALIVPFNTKTESVLNIIENAGDKLLADTGLFDYFYDENMKNKGQKSMAFHLKFESGERTLKDGEINRIMQKIIGAVEKTGWQVKK